MSKISRCGVCGGNIVEPAFEGDGVYFIPPMCKCSTAAPLSGRELARHRYNCDCDNCVTDRWEPPNAHRTGNR